MSLARRRSPGALDDLLATAREDSAEFPVLLANHAPMVLVALDRLGASPQRLTAYYENYRAANGLVPVPPPVEPIDPLRWTDGFGDRSRESDYRRFFEGEVARRGIADALAAYLPALLPGIGASAMHALMRLAYGVMRRDGAEVGTALGYWAATYLPLPPSTGAAPRTDDPAEVLAGVAALPALRHVVPESDLLWHNIKAVAWTAEFAPVIDWLRIDDAGAARLASVSLRLFAGTMDFSALHAVTGMHWVRLLMPFCPAPNVMLRQFWQVIASLVPKLGFPSLPDDVTLARWRQLPCPNWPAIKAAAAASDDEHDISLVFSASEEERVFGDRLYRVVAARRMQLIDS